MPVFIRPVTKEDEAALSNICLETSEAGKSGRAFHNYPSLPGQVYALPYINVPDCVWGFVLVDKPFETSPRSDETVVGYTLGASDSRAFENATAQTWWPPLKVQYAEGSLNTPLPTETDRKYIKSIMNFPCASQAQIAFSPAHLHIDILESHQRKGWGRRLIGTAISHLKERGLKAVWLGMDPRNEPAALFYQRLGFHTFDGAPEGVLGISVEEWESIWGWSHPLLPVCTCSSVNGVSVVFETTPSLSSRAVLSLSSLAGASSQAGPGWISSSPNNRTAKLYDVAWDVLAAGDHSHPDVEHPNSLRVTTPSLPPATYRNLPLESHPTISGGPIQNALRHQAIPVQDGHQLSCSSSSTLNGGGSERDAGPFAEKFKIRNENKPVDEKYALESYQHPCDIVPPQPVYDAKSAPRPKQSNKVSFAPGTNYRDGQGFDAEAQTPTRTENEYATEGTDIEDGLDYCEMSDRDGRRKGVIANLMEFYGITPGMNGLPYSRSQAYEATAERAPFVRHDSNASDSDTYSEILDPDDPRVTNITKRCLDDYEDERRNVLRQMDYRQRRKEQQRIRIEFNVTSILKRHQFLLKLARALMMFGAPSHRIESQLVAAARILEINAEFIHLPSVIICCFGDNDTMTSETHFVKGTGGLALGNLHRVHLIYRAVLHDEISARKATQQLEDLLSAKPLYSVWFRCMLSFFLSVLICPLAFGGSFLDMWIAGCGAFLLCFLQLSVATKSTMYNNVFEITTAMFMSFTARGLSSIRSQIFCYEAISSAGIIGILPGFLILTSSLELASKNIVCGSVKMVYALIYTLFLGFGLQIGSDLYLLFDPTARHHLATLAAKLSTTITLIGTFAPDNSTDGTPPAIGTFAFTNATNVYMADIVDGCYRPPSFSWFIQPFPWWTQFIIVPIFSVLSSLANLQPWKSKELPVMVIISCASYATNKVANHYIFNRSDIVSAIGAFTVGLLGNIYSRKMGGTAFTSMVTGVLFLVPSGLSQAGGITANGSAVDVGSAMIAVTIGITVGLFMSQAIVYMFGSRKNAAVFSF